MPEIKSDSNVKSTIEIVAGIVKEVPIYNDALQPAAKQVGQSLETITKTINIALSPIKALVWGYEQIETWLIESVSKKLAEVPQANIVTPLPNIAGPAIEALRYIGYNDNLRELYANLIATAMDTKSANYAHPGYVEILKNLSSDEAILLQVFIHTSIHPVIHIKGRSNNGTLVLYKRYYNQLEQSVNLQFSQLTPSYIDNLIRLGLLESPIGVNLVDNETYIKLETANGLVSVFKEICELGRTIEIDRSVIRLTSFGGAFIQNVVVGK